MEPEQTRRKTEAEKFRDSKWYFAFNNLGLPVIILGLICYAGVSVFNRTADWIEPKADAIIKKHIEIVETAKELGAESLQVQRENQETNKLTTEILARMSENTKPLAGINGECLQITKEIREDVRDIHRATVGQLYPRPRPSGTPPKVGTASKPENDLQPTIAIPVDDQ